MNRLLLLFLLLHSTSQNAQYVEQTMDTIPFKLVDNRIYLPVVLEGNTYDFLMDTGASGMGRIDSLLVDQLQLTIRGKEDNFDGVQSSSINKVVVPTIKVGRFVKTNCHMLSRNYNRNRKGRKMIWGIIGRNFWDEHLLTIDYKNQWLLIENRELRANAPHTLSYKNNFEVPIVIGGLATTANLDSGSTLSIHLPYPMSKKLRTTVLEPAGTGRRANTTFSFWRAQLRDTLELGGNVITEADLLFSKETTHINIGAALLKHFKILIDQRHHLVSILPYTQQTKQ